MIIKVVNITIFKKEDKKEAGNQKKDIGMNKKCRVINKNDYKSDKYIHI